MRLPPSELLSGLVKTLVCLSSRRKKEVLKLLDEVSVVAELQAGYGLQFLPNNVLFPLGVVSYPIGPIRKVIMSALSEPTGRERLQQYRRLVDGLKLRKN